MSSHRSSKMLLALVLAATMALSGMQLTGLTLTGVASAQDASDDPSDDPSESSSESDDDASDDASDDPSEQASESDDQSDDDGGDDHSTDRIVSGARVFGADRLSTAVAISQYEFPGGAAEVYLARADNFADAVAAGALKRGPVLLVPTCGDLPVVVAGEITRLRPHRVVALGGPGAICDDMLTAAITTAQAAASATSGDDDDNDRPVSDDDPRTETVQFLNLAAGQQATIDAAPGGTVTIERTEGGVTLVEAVPADGYTEVPESSDPGQVEVSFRDGDTRVDVEAEVEDGQVRVRIRTRED